MILDRPGRSVPRAAGDSPGGMKGDPVALFAQGEHVLDRLVLAKALPVSPVLTAAADVGGGDGSAGPGRGDRVTTAGQAAEPGPAAQERAGEEGGGVSVAGKARQTAELASSPESAGLLTAGLPGDLATLERAIRALAGPPSEAGARGWVLLRWLGLSTWLLGATLAYALARGRGTQPSPGLAGRGHLGPAGLGGEDLP
jgi:hypothetical protein